MKGIPGAYFVVCLLLHAWLCRAQTREFLITPPEGRSYESRYGSISVIDARYDSLDNGFVLVNGKKVSVIFATSLRKQLASYVISVTDTSEAKGKMLLLLRKFKLVERSDIDFEYGWFFFRASLFAMEGATYKRLNDIDTLITLKEREVSDTLMEDARKTLCSFVRRGFKAESQGRPDYSYPDIISLDEHEKKIIGIYSTPVFTNGVYLSWKSFRDQTPDYRILSASYKWNGSARLKVKDTNGRTVKLTGNDVYGFVDKNVPYIVSDHGVCIVERRNGELFYAFRSKRTSDNDEYALPETAAENLGKQTATALAGNGGVRGVYGLFVSRIDHVDGSFMRVKKIK